MTEGLEASDEEANEQTLGRAVQILLDRSQAQLAALLLDCRIVRFEYIDSLFALPLDDSDPIALVDIWVEAPTFISDRIDEELGATIHDALNEAVASGATHVRQVRYTPPPVSADWREQASARLGEGPINQGTLGRTVAAFDCDGMRFRSAAEVAVYRALLTEQAKRPHTDNLTILPLPSAKVVGNRFEPDFVVIYKGATGIIEVDGPDHRGKAADDRSRDRIFRHCGVVEVDRIDVADVEKPYELERFVAAFLYRLGRASR